MYKHMTQVHEIEQLNLASNGWTRNNIQKVDSGLFDADSECVLRFADKILICVLVLRDMLFVFAKDTNGSLERDYKIAMRFKSGDNVYKFFGKPIPLSEPFSATLNDFSKGLYIQGSVVIKECYTANPNPDQIFTVYLRCFYDGDDTL
jgi:hypothetical protein